MEQKINNLYDYEEEVLEEELVLNFEEYTDFMDDQNSIYQNLFTEKIVKNDSIKFY